ncbi:MAG TPA: hypothetical protein VMV29_16225 [Ktedonobacterales bacterium]|nr:hypothetical protein [Ktedonobacterales bacterium]
MGREGWRGVAFHHVSPATTGATHHPAPLTIPPLPPAGEGLGVGARPDARLARYSIYRGGANGGVRYGR